MEESPLEQPARVSRNQLQNQCARQGCRVTTRTAMFSRSENSQRMDALCCKNSANAGYCNRMNPLLASLNQEQTAAVLCDKTAVCAAGAGSGKTRVISARFAYLITEKNYKIDQILTLTFTKKSALEMYKRIYETLKTAAATLEGAQKQNAQEALDSFHKANIKTTDAYCNALLKQCAMRYGIKNDFEINNKKCADFAMDEALPFLLTHANHSAICELYGEKKLDDIARDIFVKAAVEYNPIDAGADFFEHAKAQMQTVLAEYEKTAAAVEAYLVSLASFAEDAAQKQKKTKTDEKLIAFSHNVENHITLPSADELRAYLVQLLDAPHTERVPIAKAHNVRTMLLKTICTLAEGIKINLPQKACELKTVLNDFRETLTQSFFPLVVFCAQAGVILSVSELVCEFQNTISKKKRTLGVLTFDDVARLALKALKEQEYLLKSEQKKIKAIMIDEFQDNNSLQKELLFLLAGEKKSSCLFFVGDEKQSIYKFRGADVAVFNELKNEVRDLGGENLSLKTNYRSAPALIEIFNDIFPFVFEKKLQPYEASYIPLEAGKDASVNAAHAHFSLCVLDKKSAAETDTEKDTTKDSGSTEDEDDVSLNESEAFFVARTIHEMLSKNAGKIAPSDIAVLFRSTTHQKLFEKYLNQFGIPYIAEKINGFFADAPVNDMMAALRLTAYPNDALARAQVDASPLVTETIMTQLKEKSYSYSVSKMVSELWYALGYRYETLWNKNLFIYRNLYDYLFELARIADADGANLASFCDEIAQLQTNGGAAIDELSLPLAKTGAVTLMTVHKSKGLEFKIVFVVGCGNRRQNHANTQSIYKSARYGFSLNPPIPIELKNIDKGKLKRNYFFEQDKALEIAKDEAELKRLLYVALTRAEEQLFVTGNYPLAKPDAQKKHTFFDLFLPAILCPENAIEDDTVDDASNSTYTITEIPSLSYTEIKRLTAFADAAPKKRLESVIECAKPFYKNAKILPVESVVSNRTTPTKLAELTDSKAVMRNWIFKKDYSGKSAQDVFLHIETLIETIGAAAFGEFVHSYIEAYLKNDTHALKRNLLSRLDEKKCALLIESTKRIADNFFESALGVMCKNAAWTKNELRFRTFTDTLFPNPVFIDGTIDLLFADAASGDIFIVDFKTDKADKTLDEMENTQIHTAQLTCYLDAVKNIYGKPNERTFTAPKITAALYYLRSGHAFELAAD